MTIPRSARIIIPESGGQPEPHEILTAEAFISLGRDVEFIVPSRIKGSRSPDVIIDGIAWEMKSPLGKSKKTVANALRRAVKQSNNVIVDGRRMRLSDEVIQMELVRNIHLVRTMRRLVFIAKTGEVIVLK